MALSNGERQARYRKKLKTGALARIEVKMPYETAIKLTYLARHWHCTKTEALARMLAQTWEREGEPIPDAPARKRSLSDNVCEGKF